MTHCHVLNIHWGAWMIGDLRTAGPGGLWMWLWALGMVLWVCVAYGGLRLWTFLRCILFAKMGGPWWSKTWREHCRVFSTVLFQPSFCIGSAVLGSALWKWWHLLKGSHKLNRNITIFSWVNAPRNRASKHQCQMFFLVCFSKRKGSR